MVKKCKKRIAAVTQCNLNCSNTLLKSEICTPVSPQYMVPCICRKWGIPFSLVGVVHTSVGQNVTPHNPSLGLFLYHFLHTMSLWSHASILNNTSNQQTPPPWWWPPLQRHGFSDTTPPKGRAALRMFVPRPLSKDFVWLVKLMYQSIYFYQPYV